MKISKERIVCPNCEAEIGITTFGSSVTQDKNTCDKCGGYRSLDIAIPCMHCEALYGVKDD